MFLFSKSIIPDDSKILDRDLEHVLWKLTILSDLGEHLHAALDWEVTLLRCGAVPTKTPKLPQYFSFLPPKISTSVEARYGFLSHFSRSIFYLKNIICVQIDLKLILFILLQLFD